MATLPKNLQSQMQKESQTAIQNGYNKANYQSGYGIGNSANITGGFNSFNDSNALRNEIGRVNTVMGNRSGFGLGNDQYTSYYDKLNSAYSPFNAAETKATTAQNAYTQQQQSANDAYSKAFAEFDGKITGANDAYQNGAGFQGYQQSMSQTVDSIASKYGFTFNRDSAKTQAEAEAQALRDANADAGRKNESANKLNTGKIDANLMNMAEGLDRSYFQQMMGQQQNQVNGGLNAGIASDQDLRLQMNRQAEMGSAYRDANLGTMEEQQRFTNEQLRLTEGLGTINQQSLAREQSLMSDWEKQMYDVISNDRDFYKGAADMEWGQSQDLVNQYLAQQGALTGNHQWQSEFDYGAMRDTVGDSQFDKTLAQNQFEAAQGQENYNKDFNYQAGRDKVTDGQWNQSFNLEKLLSEAGLTGNYNGDRTLAGTASDLNQSQFDWAKQMDQSNLQLSQAELSQRQHEFNNMSASQRASFEQNSYQFGEEMAWKLVEMRAGNALTQSIADAELKAYTSSSSGQSSTSGSGVLKNYASGTLSNVKGSVAYAENQKFAKGVASYYLDNFKVSSGYGPRNMNGNTFHYGTDFAGKAGTDIPSLTGGKVTKVYNNHKTAGNGIIVTGADGRTYEYIHMQSLPNYKVGDTIEAGKVLGKIGSTGASTGPHLDFKIKENGKYIDSYKFLASRMK